MTLNYYASCFPLSQGLGLVINMIEHSASNRQRLERLHVQYHLLTMPPGVAGASQETAPTTSAEVEGRDDVEDGRSLLRGRNSSIKALIGLFLKHYYKAEGATIEVALGDCKYRLDYHRTLWLLVHEQSCA